MPDLHKYIGGSHLCPLKKELVQPLEKVLADVVEEDMPDLHKYIGGSHLCPLKIVAIGLTLQI